MRIDDVVDVRVQLRLELFDLTLRHLVGVNCGQRRFAGILRRWRNSQILLVRLAGRTVLLLLKQLRRLLLDLLRLNLLLLLFRLRLLLLLLRLLLWPPGQCAGSMNVQVVVLACKNFKENMLIYVPVTSATDRTYL